MPKIRLDDEPVSKNFEDRTWEGATDMFNQYLQRLYMKAIDPTDKLQRYSYPSFVAGNVPIVPDDHPLAPVSPPEDLSYLATLLNKKKKKKR